MSSARSVSIPLMEAAKRGDLDRLNTLLTAGVDVHAVDKNGHTALHGAASLDRTEAVLALLNAGADVNKKNKGGITALHVAAGDGHINTVMALLAADANVNEKDNLGYTALHCATGGGHTKTVMALLEADLNSHIKAITTLIAVVVKPCNFTTQDATERELQTELCKLTKSLKCTGEETPGYHRRKYALAFRVKHKEMTELDNLAYHLP